MEISETINPIELNEMIEKYTQEERRPNGMKFIPMQKFNVVFENGKIVVKRGILRIIKWNRGRKTYQRFIIKDSDNQWRNLIWAIETQNGELRHM